MGSPVVTIDDKGRVVVQGVGFVKRHTRPNPQRNIKGGIAEREAAIHHSKVMLIDPKTDAPTRIRRRRDAAADDTRQHDDGHQIWQRAVELGRDVGHEGAQLLDLRDRTARA